MTSLARTAAAISRGSVGAGTEPAALFRGFGMTNLHREPRRACGQAMLAYAPMKHRGSPPLSPLRGIPDVRDGLTREERVVLWILGNLQRERGGRDVPTAMLYGRVVEHIDMSVPELQRILARLIGPQG